MRAADGGPPVLAALVVTLAAGLAVASTPDAGEAAAAARQEAGEAEADTAGREVARRDTIQGDTIPGDTTRVDVAGRREALGGGEFPDRDELFRSLLELPGYQIIEYRGEEVTLRVPERVIDLTRNAQVNYGSDVLRAQEIRYLGELRFLRASREIELVGSQTEPVTSDSSLLYDVSGRRGTIFDARTSFGARGTNWYFQGDAIPVGQDTLYGDPGRFTSCELEVPHYAFRAGQIKAVSNDFVVAWPVTLYVGNVPVMWLPFFAQDIRPGRRSGILPPRFGFNDVVRTSDTYDRHVEDFGYYWAINEFMDASVTMDWFSGNYTRVNADFRYDFMKKFMNGSLGVGRSWGADGNSVELSWTHSHDLSPGTHLRASVDFVENTRIFQDRSFDPEDQTRTVDSDVAFSHRMEFANVSVNARRRQFLGGDGKVQMTLPSVNLNFSPVTLFQAPRNRAGPFNNITWNGSARFSRTTTDEDQGPSEERRRGSASTSFRVGSFNLSGRTNFDQQLRTPVDSAGVPLSERGQTTLDWSSSLDYQLGLVGNTVARPSADVSGAVFRSDSTGGQFLSAPIRASVGVSLSTDLYGFFPGIGPFSQFRHRISPQVSWRYSPEVTTDRDRAEIPGFPEASGEARNRLSVSLNQTIEAKVEAAGSELEGEGEAPAVPDTTVLDTVAPDTVAPDTATRDTTPGDTAAAPAGRDTAAGSGGEEAAGAGTGADADQEGRKITILSLNTSPLEFDFERRKEDLPVLVTEEISANVDSDLLRGLSLRMSYDLFEGSGNQRIFSPFLTRLSTSFSFRSGMDLGEALGLGLGGDDDEAGRDDARGRPGGGFGAGRGGALGRPGGGFDPRGRRGRDRGIPPEARGSGPWDLSLDYSLSRGRPGEAGQENQTVSGTLRLEPTPNWSVWWRTQYNVTSGEFGSHQLELERDLHRWRATFRFMKSPNGNFLFDVLVQLIDAPEVQVDYNQRTRAGQ